ncbi:MAG TPA: YraN family protein [Alphaproteobacteria bacterium]|nr:YraN family protein [Alphaproteobacteria bacterium]
MRRLGAAHASAARRRRAYRRGRLSEAICRLVLRCKGYRILAQNYHSPVGEVDIIARRGAMLILVEVKARQRLEDAAEAVGARQRQRIARAATAFLAQNRHLSALSVRFDVMLVRSWRWPRHIANAWQSEERSR